MPKPQGFTLIEVLIATVVMVVALMALAYGLSQGHSVTETARNQDIALSAIQQKLEEISYNIATIEDYNKSPLNTFAVSGLTPITPDAQCGAITVTEVLPDELYEITVTVQWQQKDGRNISREVKTTLVQKQ